MLLDGVFGILDFMKFNFGRGSAPDLAWGSLQRSPDPLVGWEGGYLGGRYPHPITHALDAFGVSFLTFLKAGAAPEYCTSSYKLAS